MYTCICCYAVESRFVSSACRWSARLQLVSSAEHIKCHLLAWLSAVSSRAHGMLVCSLPASHMYVQLQWNHLHQQLVSSADDLLGQSNCRLSTWLHTCKVAAGFGQQSVRLTANTQQRCTLLPLLIRDDVSVNNAMRCMLLNTHKSSDWWAVNIVMVFTCAGQHNKHNCWALAAWAADWDMSSYRIITYWSYGDNERCDWGAVPPQHMCIALEFRWWTGLHAWVESRARKAWCFQRVCVADVYVMCQICHFQFTCQSLLTGVIAVYSWSLGSSNTKLTT